MDGECAGGVVLHCRKGWWRFDYKVVMARGTSGYCELATGAWPLVGGDCACCSTHLALEALTLGVVGMGIARTNCQLSSLFGSE